MKIQTYLLVISVFLSVMKSNAATKWTNCVVMDSKAQAIAEVFWKSDIDGGNGPIYNLPSGQTLSNAGIVCSEKKIDNFKQWINELKSGINPSKSVSSFKMIKSAQEFKNFLENFGTSISDPQELDSAVSSFLDGKSTIIVGSSQKQAVILLAHSEGKSEIATFLQLDKKK